MAVRIQLRRDTAANWSSTNPVLNNGEPGFDTTNKILKIGDGVTAWNDLDNKFATDAQGALADSALQPADIGVTVQGYSANTVIDANYVATENSYTTTEKNKLAGIESNATANDTDANLLNRANHTGTQTAATISDFDTEVSNNTDVAANTSARHDAVTVVDSSEIDFTLTGQQITASIVAGSIDESKLDASVNASLDLADSSVQLTGDQSIAGIKTFTTALILPNNSRINNIEHFYQTTKPTTRGDASALVAGDRWWKTDTGEEWFWNGTYWLSSNLRVSGLQKGTTTFNTNTLFLGVVPSRTLFFVDYTYWIRGLTPGTTPFTSSDYRSQSIALFDTTRFSGGVTIASFDEIDMLVIDDFSGSDFHGGLWINNTLNSFLDAGKETNLCLLWRVQLVGSPPTNGEAFLRVRYREVFV